MKNIYKTLIGAFLLATNPLYAVITGCLPSDEVKQDFLIEGGTQEEYQERQVWKCSYVDQNGQNPRFFFGYLPNGFGANPKKKYPIVVVLHGHLDRATRIISYAKLTQASDRHQFILVAPDGYKPDRFFSSRHWNDGRVLDEYRSIDPITKVETDLIDDVRFISDLTQDVLNLLPANTNPQQRYVMGMSNGGAMTLKLACDTNIFAGFAVVSATMHTNLQDRDCKPIKAAPLVFVHGTKDGVMPKKDGDDFGGNDGGTGYSINTSVNFWLKKRGQNCQFSVPSTNVGLKTPKNVVLKAATTGCTAKISHYEYIKGRHEWPANSDVLSDGRFFKKRDDIDATTTIMKFFGFSG